MDLSDHDGDGSGERVPLGEFASGLKRDDLSVYSPCSGMQMHMDGNNPLVKKVYLNVFKAIIKKM